MHAPLRVLLGALCLAALLAGLGCQPKPSTPAAAPPPTTTPTPTGPSTTKAGASKVLLAYSISSVGHQFFVDMLAGVKEEAKQQSAELVSADASADAGRQLTDIENLLQKKPAAIMITPQDSDAIVPAVQACTAKGVPVVIIDIGASGGQVGSFIISDNFQGGRLAGEYIAEHLKPGTRVAHIQCQLGAANARKRGEGFTAVMKEKGIAVIPPQPADSMRDKAMTVMENFLQAHKDIGAVFAENDPMAVGAAIAAQNAGRLGEMIVVGFNGDPEALELVRKGELAATVMQFPYDMGVAGVQQALKLARGEAAEAQVDVPVELVTKDNIDQFEGYRRKKEPAA